MGFSIVQKVAGENTGSGELTLWMYWACSSITNRKMMLFIFRQLLKYANIWRLIVFVFCLNQTFALQIARTP